MIGERFPLVELEEILGRPGPGALARRLRVSGQRLRQLQRIGLDERQADRLAVRVGFHPANVWRTWG